MKHPHIVTSYSPQKSYTSLGSMLASLPPESLSLILDHLPTEALLSLRTTSKTFLCITTPRVCQVFSDFHFDLCEDLPRQLQRVQFFSNPFCTIAPYVISLHIESLQLNHYDGPAISTRTVLSKHLIPSISKLRNLETAR
jgi:F-box domain